MQSLFTFMRALTLCLLIVAPARADEITIGNDIYASGESANLTNPSARDIFASGFSVNVKARAEKDVHVAGFNVYLDAPIGGNAYAAGYSVSVTQPVSGDLTSAGFSISIGQGASVSSNARLAARTVTVDSPISGSLLAAAGDLSVNSVISGDAQLTATALHFGSNAKINGKLKYYAPEPMTIPETVISADRVQYEKLNVGNASAAVRDTGFGGFWPSFFSLLAGFILAIAFLVAMAAVLLAFAPQWLDQRKAEALHAPVKMMALGVLALSLAIGLVPVSGMTLIGLPLIPFAILAVMVLWVLGFIVGAYAIAEKLNPSSGSTAIAGRLAVLAACFVVLSLLNYIPVIGWLCNLAVLFLGLGTIMMQMARYITHQVPQPG